MVAYLKPYFDFYVVTQDRDVADTKTYPGVTPDTWHRVGSAWVFYCSVVGPTVLRRAFQQVQPDLISLHSFQDKFTRIMVALRRAGAFGNTPTLLAPRGEFSSGAMKIKRTQKAVYLRFAKLLGLHEDLLWQVSTPREKEQLLHAAPARRLDPDSINVAYNLSDAVVSTAPHIIKQSGSARLAFISRITAMKNLHFLLEILRTIRGKAHLNIFGPVAHNDSAYWESCRAQLVTLPDNITVEYRGQLDHSAVPQVLHEHHFFVLPTKGENFCHAAVESFVNGTPVILSDESPWTGLTAVRAGFDIPLQDRKRWHATLQECVDMDQQSYADYLKGAGQYGRRFSREESVRQHLAMFTAAMDGRSERKHST
jgi:glycosyltransferase involved in cell wall biosynthesis